MHIKKELFLKCNGLYLLVVLMLLCLCQTTTKQGIPPALFKDAIPDTIKIVSYNPENLFDFTLNGNEYPEYKPGNSNWTINTFETKLDNVASVISAINPHIAVLVEIENENTVSLLRKALSGKKCVYPYYAIGDPSYDGNTRPVILSKFPLVSQKSFGTINKEKHERPMLEVAVFLGKDTLTVFACHWPSKKASETRRIEKAQELMNRCKELAFTHDYIVAGDFNENYDECETFHTAGLDDSKGITGMNHVMKTVLSLPKKPLVYVNKYDCATATTPVHYDTWLEKNENERYSAKYKGRQETPDHFLLPHSLFDTLGLSYVDSSFRVFTWNGRLLKNGEPFRWQEKYTKQGKMHVGEGFSDHLPLVLLLAKKPYRVTPHDTNAKKNGSAVQSEGGFEDGMDGFIACVKQIKVERDTANAKTGRYSLQLKGSAKVNGCAARSVISLPTSAEKKSCVLNLWLRGSGTINMRIGNQKTKKWCYYNGEKFIQAKGGKYTAYSFLSWRKISLPIVALSENMQEIDFEIRSKKDTNICLWIDDVKIQRALSSQK